MKIEALEDDKFSMLCTREELVVLNNALNNIPQAVDAEDHATLIGATQDEAERLLATIHAALIPAKASNP